MTDIDAAEKSSGRFADNMELSEMAQSETSDIN
jgi:hypothetical protein